MGMGTKESDYLTLIITELICTCFTGAQSKIHTRWLWRGCRLYMQLWRLGEDGLEELLFERWHYTTQVFPIRKTLFIPKIKLYLSGYRYDHNRGHHFDRKRRR